MDRVETLKSEGGGLEGAHAGTGKAEWRAGNFSSWSPEALV